MPCRRCSHLGEIRTFTQTSSDIGDLPADKQRYLRADRSRTYHVTAPFCRSGLPCCNTQATSDTDIGALILRGLDSPPPDPALDEMIVHCLDRALKSDEATSAPQGQDSTPLRTPDVTRLLRMDHHLYQR